MNSSLLSPNTAAAARVRGGDRAPGGAFRLKITARFRPFAPDIPASTPSLSEETL